MAPAKHTPAQTAVAVLLFGCAAGAAAFAVFRLAGHGFGPVHLAIIGGWTLLSAALQAWQEASLTAGPKGFMPRFATGLAVKLLVAVAAIAALLFLRPRAEALPMALLFIGLYLAFLAFSTIRLSAMARRAPRN